MRARHRISKLLLRHDLLWEGSTWTIAHEPWLAEQRFAARGLRIAYEESLAAMYAVQARRVALDAAIAEEAAQEPWAGIVGRLCCLRGVSVLTAFGLAVEIGDWQRFDGRSIGAYLGLVPRESSSGERRSLGPSPRPATVTHGAFWSRPPGITAGRCAKAASWPVGVRASHPWYASAPKRRDGACTAAPDAQTVMRIPKPAHIRLTARRHRARCAHRSVSGPYRDPFSSSERIRHGPLTEAVPYQLVRR
jgi:hypothetical protein